MSRSIQRSLAGSLLFLTTLCGVLPAPDPEAARAEPPASGHKAYTDTIPDTKVTFDMVPIPGGEFLMGSPENEPGRNADEGPQHPVAIRAFWMGKYLVTWDEFDIWRKELGVGKPQQNDEKLKANPDALTGPTPPYVDERYGHGSEGHPAICMTNHAAMEYCRWLSNKTGKVYRLPTEAEWEYACRAGTKTAYSFGDDPKKLAEYGWYEGNSDEHTQKVGSKKPNPWGLYDMHGNVLEWCLDHYQKDYYSSFPTDKVTLSPVLLPTETRFSHVARGGAWTDNPAQCRSAARRGSDKSWIKSDPQRPQSIWWLTNTDFVGFRIVRAVEEQANLKGLRSKVTRTSKNENTKPK
jgi:formylglycine-generating enzyme required for sulfatase activity